jgi:hypothetical protein
MLFNETFTMQIINLNAGFAELKGKPLNTSFWHRFGSKRICIRNVMIYSQKLYT